MGEAEEKPLKEKPRVGELVWLDKSPAVLAGCWCLSVSAEGSDWADVEPGSVRRGE